MACAAEGLLARRRLPLKCCRAAAVRAQHISAPAHSLAAAGQQGRKLLAKLYSLNTDTWTWRRHALDTLPCPRAGHAMAAVDRGPGTTRALFMFGGQGKKLLNDLFMLTLDAQGGPVVRELQGHGKPPTPRCATAARRRGGNGTPR